MEEIRVSEDYKKAFNRADMICRYMPELLKEIDISADQANDYTKGFQDRVKQYEQEKDNKEFSVEKMKDQYREEIETSKDNKSKQKDLNREH